MPASLQECDFSVDDLTATCRLAILNRGVGNDTAASSGPLFAGRVFLLRDAVDDVRDKALADLTLADYDGHDNKALTWVTAVLDETGEPIVVANRLTFVATGHATIGENTIRAVALTGSDSVTLMGAANLPIQTIVNESTPFYLDILLTLPEPASPG